MKTNAQLKIEALKSSISGTGESEGLSSSLIGGEAVPGAVLDWTRDLLDGTKAAKRGELRRKLSQLGLGEAERRSLHEMLLKEAAKTDLGSFAHHIFGWKAAPHHRVMLRAMEETPGNLCIVAPPSSAKTNYVGIAGTLWKLVKNINVRICYLSGTKEQAHRPSVLMRDTIQNNANFKDLFPHIRPDFNLGWAENRWFVAREVANLKDPTMKSVGVCNQIEGSRVDEYIWDDLCTRENQATAETRKSVNDWIIQVALTRLSPTGRITNVMTRYGKNDIMQLITELGNFTVLRMPALGFWESVKHGITIQNSGLLVRESPEEYLKSTLNPVSEVVPGRKKRGIFSDSNLSFVSPATDIADYLQFGIEIVKSSHLHYLTYEIQDEENPDRASRTAPRSTAPQECANSVHSVREYMGAGSPPGPVPAGGVFLGPDSHPEPGEAAGNEGEEDMVSESTEVQGHLPPQGSSLWPEYFSRNWYLKQWRLSPELFEQTYQGNPTIRSGGVFKTDWWQYYQPGTEGKLLPEPVRLVLISGDTAFGIKTTNDFSVNTVMALGVSGMIYILDLYKKKVKFPELVRDSMRLIQHWQPDRVLIENRGSGISLIQTLQLETLAPIIGINPDGDKLRRAHAVTPLVEAGRIALPYGAIWVEDFLTEMADFPHGEHDDVVDTVTQALTWLVQESLIYIEGRLLDYAGGYVSSRNPKNSGIQELVPPQNDLIELPSFCALPAAGDLRNSWLDLG